MRSNRGFSLIEILCACCCMAIIAGIAAVSYRGTMVTSAKMSIKTSVKLFASSIEACLKNAGAWKINHPERKNADGTYNPIFPCKISLADKTKAKEKLKDYMSIDCKVSSCNPKNRYCCQLVTGTADKKYCLSIRREKFGKKLQIFTIINWNKPSQYEVYCEEKTGSGAYTDVSSKCSGTPSGDMFSTTCDWK